MGATKNPNLQASLDAIDDAGVDAVLAIMSLPLGLTGSEKERRLAKIRTTFDARLRELRERDEQPRRAQ